MWCLMGIIIWKGFAPGKFKLDNRLEIHYE